MCTNASRFLAVAVVAAVSISPASGQPSGPPSAPPAAPPANDPALNQLLVQWERDMGTLQTLVVEFKCTRTYTNQGGIQKDFTGSLRSMRLPDGNFGATIKLVRASDGRVAEQYICTGNHIYNLWPDDKTVYVYTLPPRQAGQAPDDGPLPFLTGMKAEVARKRYQLQSKEPDDPKGKPWYTFVEVRPNFDRDLQDFTYARLALLKQPVVGSDGAVLVPAGMPRELRWFEPNKNQTVWNITRIQRNVPGTVGREEFAKPSFPADWKLENVSKAAANPPQSPPRVIRNQDK